MHIMLLAIGAVGHTILWVALVNRIHGLGIRRIWVDLLTVLCGIAFVLAPLFVGLALLPHLISRAEILPHGSATIAWTYVTTCALVCVTAAMQRWIWRLHSERTGALLSNHTSTCRTMEDVRSPLTAPGLPTWLARIPGNQVTDVRVQEKQLAVPRLPPALEGLRIVHLTDLHMSGRITRAYFEQIVDEVNRCEPDIVAITGDIIERPACLEWIPQTLARIRAAFGTYFVLGNHDRHVGQARLAPALVEAGLIYLGGKWCEITVRNIPIILAGNELPWFGPAADLSACPAKDGIETQLRILLAHTPDQFRWAQQNDIDLMLAGHNHGGQICFPLLGPITAPSLQGVRYAAGAFLAGNTVLHVSRGVSSLTPLRWNCSPEIAVLTLHHAEGVAQQSPG